MMSEIPRCRTCRYWHRLPNSDAEGECQIYKIVDGMILYDSDPGEGPLIKTFWSYGCPDHLSQPDGPFQLVYGPDDSVMLRFSGPNLWQEDEQISIDTPWAHLVRWINLKCLHLNEDENDE